MAIQRMENVGVVVNDLAAAKFHTPATTAEPKAPADTLGIRRIMFAVGSSTEATQFSYVV
jgi:hypothetical protein